MEHVTTRGDAAVTFASEISPVFEALECRLLLDGTVPTFNTDIPDQWVLTPGSRGLTIGVDGYDADGDPLTISASSGNPLITVSKPYDQTTAPVLAVLHFTAGDGVTPIGDITVQLLQGHANESLAAMERFITLATTGYDSTGAVDPAANPFYTNVLVHRVIDDFMIQTGDAAKGDGTGGSPLGKFNDTFDPALDFQGIGMLAMANSGGNTNDCQFFITEDPTTWLDGMHMIFGQVISGWDVLQQISEVRVDADSRPISDIFLAGVDISNSTQDGSIEVTADAGFTGTADVTITLDDGNGNTVQKVITLTAADDLGTRPTADLPASQTVVHPGAGTQVTVTLADDKGAAIKKWIEIDSPGLIGSVVTFDTDTNVISIDIPADFTVPSFTVTVYAEEAGGYANLAASTGTLLVNVAGNTPTISDVPGLLTLAPGQSRQVTPTLTDDSPRDIILSAASNDPNVTVSVDAATNQVTIEAKAGTLGLYAVTLSAVEAGFNSDLAPTTKTLWVIVQNAGDPAAIGVIDLSADAAQTMGTALDNNILYVARSDAGLAVYDVSNPSAPVLKDSLNLGGQAWDVKIQHATRAGLSATIAYVAMVDKGTAVVDVTDPANITLIKTLGTGAASVSLCIMGNLLLQSDWTYGLVVWDITDPDNIQWKRTIQQIFTASSPTANDAYYLGHVVACAAVGNKAYVIDAEGRYGNGDRGLGVLFVIDLSTPTTYHLDSYFVTGGVPWDVAVQNGVAYILDQYAGLIALDVTNPAAPKKISSVAIAGMQWSNLAVSGTLAVLSTTTGFQFVDISDPARMRVEYSFNGPTWGGQASIAGQVAALPMTQSAGVVMADAGQYVYDTYFKGTKKFTFPDGRTATITVSGTNTYVRLVPDLANPNVIDRLDIVGATKTSTVSITSTGGDVLVRDIRIDGSMGSFTAKTTDLLGNFSAVGVVTSLALDDVADAHTIEINTSGAAPAATDSFSLTFDRVADTAVNTHGVKINTITASEWLETGGPVEAIVAPSITTITIAGSTLQGLAGNFQADMTLSGLGAPLNKVLGTATIKGAVSGDWMLTAGNTGLINVGSTTSAFSLTTTGQVAGFNSTVGGIEGALSALYFDAISAKTLMQATITAGGAAATTGKAIGTFSAGSVNNTTITANAGGIGTLTALEWLDDGDADIEIATRWIGTMSVPGRLATTLLPLIAGNFQADMTLSGLGAPTNKVLGTATIKGAASGDWTLTAGNTGLINVGSTTSAFSLTGVGQVAGFSSTVGGIEGTLSALYFDKIAAKGLVQATITAAGAAATTGKAIGTFSAGTVNNTTITANAGGIGTLTALEWLDSGDADIEIATRWIGTMTIPGRLATTLLPLIAGNFQADVTLSGLGAPLNKVLGTATIKGAASGDWMLTAGNTGLINVGSTTSAFSLTTTGQVAGFSSTVGGIEGTLSALYFDKIAAKGAMSSAITAGGAAATTGKAIGTFSAGTVNNTTITANAGGIGTLTALEWLDSGDADIEIATRWIGTLSIPGRLATTLLPLIAGDFQADMTLTGTGAPLNKVLGTTTIKGAASGDWMLTAGNTGLINVGSTTSAFSLATIGQVAGFNSTVGGIEGTLSALYFDKIAAKGAMSSAITAGGAAATTGKAIGTFSAGTVNNTTITANAGGIGTLTALEWLDADTDVDISTRWIGTMSIPGRLATTLLPLIAGNFQADMTLTGTAAPLGKVLGTATIKGAASGDWMLTAGNTGIINAGSTAGGFTLGAAGLVAGVNVAGDLLGDLTANKFTSIVAKGNLGAGIHITGDPARQDTTIGTLTAGTVSNLVLDIAGSIGTMTAGVVTDVSLTLSGGITTMTVTEWNNADGLADRIKAGWIGTMKTLKNAKLPAVMGDFEASLDLTGVGAPLGKALGTATIAGSVTSTNADAGRLNWNVAGQAGAVTIGGAVNALTAHAGKMTSFQAGAVNDAELTVDDALGSAKAFCWNAGKIEADKIGTLSITGRLATTALPLIAGDFAANLTVKGLKAVTGPLLGTATIAHDVTGGVWTIGDAAMAAFTGNTVTTITVSHDVTGSTWMVFGSAGTLDIKGTAMNSMIRASGTITALNLGATDGSEFQAGVTAEKASADMLVADVSDLAAIKTINVHGWYVPAGQPKQFFVKGSSFLAGWMGTVNFTNAAGMDSFDIYVPDPATDVKSVKNTDNVTPTNNWTWPSANWVGSPPITAIAP
jgi:cyclophilin family peptidyl-prolyl cis-trans isomerase